MDGAASDVRFIFRFRESNESVVQGLNKWDTILLYRIEGHLTIQLNGKTILEDEYFNLMEFGVDLSRWMSSVQSGLVEDHEFWCIDYDEGPLISFRRLTDATWEIHSPWLEENSPTVCEGHALFLACRDYLINLRSQLMATYGIKLEQFEG